MDETRRQSLLGRHVAGELTDAEKKELADHVASSPEAGAEVARQLLLHRALVQAGKPSMDVARLMAALPAPRRASVDEVMHSIGRLAPVSRWRRAAAWGAAATVVTAAAAVLLIGLRAGRRPDAGGTTSLPGTPAPGAAATRSRGPVSDPAVTPRLERVNGQVYVMANAGRTPALASRQLVAGEGLLTVGKDSSASVAYVDGTRLVVGGDSVIAQFGAAGQDGAAAKAVLIARGRVLGVIVPQPREAAMVFVSPHADTVVRGTRLAMTVTSEATRVDVHEGRLSIGRSGAGRPVEVSAGRYALFREGEPPAVADQPRGGLALLVSGSTEALLNPSDRAVRQRLQIAGFEVRVLPAGSPSLMGDAPGAALIVVSSTAGATDVDARLNQVPAPILTWEPELYDDLGMTGPCEQGDCGVEKGRHGVLIKDSGHPLAAGLSGPVEAARLGGTTSWGSPAATAAWAATLAGSPTKALIFGYERGAAMPGMAAAPARRVGFFMGDDTASGLTEAGWALFDAAVSWSTARPARP